MREIQRLRMEQEAHAKKTANTQYNPTLMAELMLLRQRKDDLENRMSALQDSRKDLVTQLEALMKLLKASLMYNIKIGSNVKLDETVLMVSFCDRLLSIIRRTLCVVSILPCEHSRGHSYCLIFIEFGHNICPIN
ncbi:hypothetical protein DPMN_083410 [Dreissena polymorpha]|uniref:Uncharacterized protein n=1 Tax=Dreissena polymorpha TaxID=45954 RepID=A0A9D3YBV8_DREPO|nr:hypothetical protein DPMN_083410 [Dreissena polymorpha]